MEDMTAAELLAAEARENRTRQILTVLLEMQADGKTIEDAIQAVKMLLP